MRSAPDGAAGGATRKLVLAALFAGLGVLLSSFAVPIGASRVFPFQHAINAVAGVLLGPWWAAGSALRRCCTRFHHKSCTVWLTEHGSTGATGCGTTSQ